MIVPHCDSTPSARSDGRCVIRPSDDAVLTAFLGDPLEDLADRLAVGVLVLGDVAVGLFADQQQRALRLGPRPDRIVEHHAREHRDDDRR